MSGQSAPPGSSGPPEGAADARAAVLARIAGDQHFLIVTHQNPDGDALGSLIGMRGMLEALGKDVCAFMHSSDQQLPPEYRTLQLGALCAEPPADIAQRTAIALDCGNIDRIPEGTLDGAAHLLNIDHHHDNTNFGSVNLVVDDASCSAEIVWSIMRELGLKPSLPAAEALYIALVTDTGRFMYESTGPAAHRMAADLVELGVDVQAVYRRLYEGMPEAKVALLARGLSKMRRFDAGALTLSALSADDFSELGAEPSFSEGIVDQLRSIAGTRVAAVIRELKDGQRKISLRATDGAVDVSQIARSRGGGGHRRAAGFSTAEDLEQVVELIREQMRQQLAGSAGDVAEGG